MSLAPENEFALISALERMAVALETLAKCCKNKKGK
jgi:hypothetical protein